MFLQGNRLPDAAAAYAKSHVARKVARNFWSNCQLCCILVGRLTGFEGNWRGSAKRGRSFIMHQLSPATRLSRHATIRMQQRSIPARVVDLLLDFAMPLPGRLGMRP